MKYKTHRFLSRLFDMLFICSIWFACGERCVTDYFNVAMKTLPIYFWLIPGIVMTLACIGEIVMTFVPCKDKEDKDK